MSGANLCSLHVRVSDVTKRMGGDAKMMFMMSFLAAMFSGGGAQDWT
ncbi:MAG: hypothetical protein ABI119_10470 [Gemmatimonadaceae bacterium]